MDDTEAVNGHAAEPRGGGIGVTEVEFASEGDFCGGTIDNGNGVPAMKNSTDQTADAAGDRSLLEALFTHNFPDSGGHFNPRSQTGYHCPNGVFLFQFAGGTRMRREDREPALSVNVTNQFRFVQSVNNGLDGCRSNDGFPPDVATTDITVGIKPGGMAMGKALPITVSNGCRPCDHPRRNGSLVRCAVGDRSRSVLTQSGKTVADPGQGTVEEFHLSRGGSQSF